MSTLRLPGFLNLSKAVELVYNITKSNTSDAISTKPNAEDRRKCAERLVACLMADKIKGYYLSREEGLQLVPSGSWALPFGGGPTQIGLKSKVSSRLFLEEAELRRLFDLRSQLPSAQVEYATSEPNSDANSVHRKGRPRNYDLMQQFLTAACHLFYKPTREPINEELQFRKALVKRLEELGYRVPDPTTVREWSRRLYDDLQKDVG